MTNLKSFLFAIVLLFSCLIVHAQSRLGSATVKVNETKTITMSSTFSNVMQYQATVTSYRWYSSNSSVANVTYTNFKECRITGKAEGTCRVYFTANISIDGYPDLYYFYWDVTVSGYTSGGSSTVVNPTRAVVYPTELTLEVGQTFDMSYDVYPSNATYTSNWVSYYKDIVTVSEQGRVTAVSPGEAYIYLWVFDSQGNCSSNDLVPTCKVTVVQPTRLYDEDATEAPSAVNNANVTVNRTLTANKWNTICLPFAMSAAQVTAAFGSDVELADFTSWSSETDGNGNIVGLSIGFTDVDHIQANHPYIIKTTTNIAEFTVTNVSVQTSENPVVTVTGDGGSDGVFRGVYAANTTVPNNALFISDNKFYYSKGKTKMQAFRAYFELPDVLAGVAGQAAPQVNMIIGGNDTSVQVVSIDNSSDVSYYDCQGRRVATPGKGLYIRNGQKVIIK